MEWKTEVRKATADHRLLMGLKQVEKALKEGKGKLVVIAKTCPEAQTLHNMAKLGHIRAVDFDGTGYELGAMAKKPFSVSVLLVTKDEADHKS
ncbi:MAG TPA: 50S ribosomal protein L30e [archaeon]|nr:50S ribosomal protein L30e [archaeon]